jgi:hypothetical protein
MGEAEADMEVEKKEAIGMVRCLVRCSEMGEKWEDCIALSAHWASYEASSLSDTLTSIISFPIIHSSITSCLCPPTVVHSFPITCHFQSCYHHQFSPPRHKPFAFHYYRSKCISRLHPKGILRYFRELCRLYVLLHTTSEIRWL